MRLDDLFDWHLFSDMLTGGYVREQTHPDFPEYVIYNYTEKAEFGRVWNSVTRECRGLIINARTHEVIARPFPKFFNNGQPGAVVIPFSAPVEVYEKMDGSLGILYPTPDGSFAIATRGSFASDQALHATAYWKDTYAKSLDSKLVDRTWTLLFEIIYPENRIVVDYSGFDGLVLLGARNIYSGRTINPEEVNYLFNTDFPIAKPLFLDPVPFIDVISMMTTYPGNAEGFVVRELETENRVKLKYAEYVRLHKIITGLSEKSVWEVLSTGGSLDDVLRDLPDEFHEWAYEVYLDLTNKFYGIKGVAAQNFEISWGKAISSDGSFDRKKFAETALTFPNSGLIFGLLDSKDITTSIWKMIKPSGDKTPTSKA